MEIDNSFSRNSGESNLNNLAKEIFNKINEVRLHPIKIANKLTQIISYINKRDNILREPRRAPQKLIEGIKAFEESITFLKSFIPIEALVYDDLLGKIAQDHANEIGSKNLYQENSSNNQIISEERFKRLGTYTEMSECIHLGESDPLRIIIDLIVCDGDPKRKNREVILSNNLRQIGIGVYETVVISTEKNFVNNCVVIHLARNWKIKQKIVMNNDENSSAKKRLSKKNNFSIDMDSSNISYDRTSVKKMLTEEELISKYEKELDQDIWPDKCVSRIENKQIFSENDKIKIIKKVVLEFNDGSIKKVILSKTWKK